MSSRPVIAVAILALGAGLWSAASAAERTEIAAATQAEVAALPFAKGARTQKPEAKLDEAAERGLLEAQLKRAARHAADVDRVGSQVSAFELYQRIVKDHADVRPGQKDARGVARAYVALGSFYRTGIPDVVSANKARAASLLHYAASYYGDADAQCDLARMYLDGDGIEKNGPLAASWLANAAKKRHGRAQALLGDLLIRGSGDLRAQPDKGLALLSVARQNASDETEARWIEGLYRGAMAGMSPAVQEMAEKYAADWQQKLGRADRIISIESRPAKSAAAKPDASVQGDGVLPVGLKQGSVAR